MANTISILGCGWLGLPLGAFLLEEGFTVKGSTTQSEKLAELAKVGIQPFLISLQPHPGQDQLGALNELLQSDILIINIPPRVDKQGEVFHPAQIRHLIEHIKGSPVQKLIYFSSTSVYPEANREVTEAEVLTGHDATSRALLQAEEMIQQLQLDWVILRCGGLMGYNRVPGKYVVGKKDVRTGSTPVNFVHRDDVIGIIHAIIEQAKWNQIYNVVAPQHPTRRDIYEQNARDFGYALPEFTEYAAAYKLVSGAKLASLLHYPFRYPNPITFHYTP